MKHNVEPIRNKNDVHKVEKYLEEHNLRDMVLWVLGVNSGLRVSDIVALNVEDVKNKTHIDIVEKKTQKHKRFPINRKLKKVLNRFIKGKENKEPLFVGKHGKRLDRREVYRFINRACKDLNLQINAGTHTMRKTFGYHHYQQYKDAVLLQSVFNHSSCKITKIYIGISQDEIDLSYKNFEL